MNRNFILFVIVATVAGRMSVCMNSPGGVARGQTTAAQPVLQDNFDDNKKGTPWKIFGETVKAKATEINKRLEFTTPADANIPFTGYLSDKWWIDPNQDFQMKVDLYFDIYAFTDGWVCFGLTPNPGGPKDQYAALGIGCSSIFANYWQEWKHGYEIRSDFTGRVRAMVTLYIFYDSWYDILYLSDSGYEPAYAWESHPGLVKDRWNRPPLYVFLGTTTENLAIASGDAYLDNFVIEKGKLGSPYQDPTQPPGGGGGGGQVMDVTATLAVVPSVIRRQASEDKITVLVGLPKEVALADWDPARVPTLTPGTIAANAQTAFVWVDDTVKILASFSKTMLMQAIPNNGQLNVHIVGQLKDGRYYVGTCPITIQ